MLLQQRTIKREISISGIGLHTGVVTSMTFRPAPIDAGIRFRRVDLPGQPEIPALVDYVSDVSRGTTLKKGEAKVHTVEHVLAAIVGLQIDNLVIELNNIEPPICDGSAKDFVDALLQADFDMQDAPKDFLVINETVRYTDEKNRVDIVALPTDDYRITVMIDYQNPILGSQHTGLFNLEKEFAQDFAPARTFCFLHEVEALYAKGLIRGGNQDNAIVIADQDLTEEDLLRISQKLGLNQRLVIGKNGTMNNKDLRFKNEPARHKLLDIMGDLALIGVPIRAQILAARPGHAGNVEFAKKIRKLYQQEKLVKKYQFERKEGVVFDSNALLKILPHRYPFMMVDKIVEFKLDERIVGVKNVTVSDWFFQGHFPGRPIMPGVLICEAMAQTGGVLLLNGMENPEGKLAMFTSINNCRFRKPVVPGDQLLLEVTIQSRRANIAIMKARAFVNDELAAEADFSAAIVDRNDSSLKIKNNNPADASSKN
jgi:UDP-3-O-[3-hydroxymyristoyl] N-acetylglucosamine deacetylase/3-hydroxyacyl-[acyl-carrier-protein] dehydratase